MVKPQKGAKGLPPLHLLGALFAGNAHPGFFKDEFVSQPGLFAGGKNGVLVVFKHGQPVLNVGSVAFNGGIHKTDMPHHEGRAKLRNQFFKGVCVITKTLAELAI